MSRAKLIKGVSSQVVRLYPRGAAKKDEPDILFGPPRVCSGADASLKAHMQTCHISSRNLPFA